ncbi:MAG TPA: hypothetical protein VGG33_05900 [Polyangia bacterium]
MATKKKLAGVVRRGILSDIPKQAKPRKAPRPPIAARISFTLPKELAEEIHHGAQVEAGGNVSAWLAEAAKRRIRGLARREAVKAYEAQHGEITADEMAEARKRWANR